MRKNLDPFYWILIAVSLVLHIPFIFPDIGSGESLRYALGIYSGAHDGFNNILLFNEEMSFAYYRLFVWAFKFLHLAKASIPSLMNWGSLIIGTLGIIPLYLFLKDLFGQKGSFICVLLYLFAPSIWVLHLMGHPVLFSIFFFNLGLYLLSRANISEGNLSFFPTLLGFSCFSLALCFRFDILFNSLFVLCWLIYKKCFNRMNLWKIITSGILFILFYMALKGLLFAKLSPIPSTFSNHAVSNYSPGAFVKNIATLVFGVNPFFILLFVIGSILWLKKKEYSKIALIISWIAPILLVAFFRDMDFPRIAAIVYPAFFLPITALIGTIKKKNIIITLAAIVVSQVFSILLYKPVISLYQFKYYDSDSGERIVTERVPLGNMFSDHFYMVKRNQSMSETAKKITSIEHGPLFVVGDQTIFYKYAVITSLNEYSVSVIPVEGTNIWKVVSPANTYQFIQLWGNDSPWHAIINDNRYQDFHFIFIPTDIIRYPGIILPEGFKEIKVSN